MSMKENKYKLFRDNKKTSTGTAFIDTFGFQLSNFYKYDDITHKTSIAGDGNQNYLNNTVSDEFLYFSTGYGDYGACYRYDETLNTLIKVQRMGQSNCASVAIDKVRKKVWFASYSSTILLEYDYSGIFYSGATAAVLTNRTTADGLIDTKMGYGPSGGGMIYLNDILYYTSAAGYQKYIRRWDTVGLSDYGNLPMMNGGTGLGNYRGGMTYDAENDRIFNFALYGNKTSVSVVENASNITGATLTVINPATSIISLNYTRIGCYDLNTPDDIFFGYNSSPSIRYVNVRDAIDTATPSSIIYSPVKMHKVLGNSQARYNQDWETGIFGASYAGEQKVIKNSVNNPNYIFGNGYTYIQKYPVSVDFQNAKIINWNKGYAEYFPSSINPNTGYVANLYSDIDDFSRATANPYFGKIEHLPIYSSEADGANPYIINTGKTYHISSQYSYTVVNDFGTTIPYQFTSGFTATFGDFHNFQTVTDNLVDLSDYSDMHDVDIVYSGGTFSKTGNTNGYTLWDLTETITPDTWYELDINMDYYSGKMKDNPYFTFMLGNYDLTSNPYYTVLNGKYYIKSWTTVINDKFYLRTENNYSITSLQIRRVEKQLIDEIKLDNLIDNIFYMSGSTLDVSVNGESFDLSSTNHKMETPATDIEITFSGVSTDDRFVGTYIQSDDLLEVTTYSYNKVGMTTDGEILIKLSDNDSNIDFYQKA